MNVTAQRRRQQRDIRALKHAAANHEAPPVEYPDVSFEEKERLADQFACDYEDYEDLVDRFCGDAMLAQTARGYLHEMRTQILPRIRRAQTFADQLTLCRDMRLVMIGLCDCIDDAAMEMVEQEIQS